MERFDIVVYGATGFTGRLALQLLRERAPHLAIASAGRSADKLATLDGPSIVADSTDPSSVEAMAAQARVVLSTAGPYGLYGDPVVDACVKQGAHYCDITGETPWVRQVIDRHHEAAMDKGLRLVPFCGYDSVPSDLCALLAVRELGGGECTGLMKLGGGGLNGGSLASALHMAETWPRSATANPFLLDPEPKISRERWAANADPTTPIELNGAWGAPWVMGPINTRVVRRSAALLDYGDDFSYQEFQEHRSRHQARRWTQGLGTAVSLLGQPWGRSLIRRFGPRPGQGPTEEQMEKGFARLRVHCAGGQVTWSAQGDAGNRITCSILAECALMLLEDLETPTGVVPPAVAFGLPLVERLRTRGMRFSLER